jgi:hypothetical protein
LGFYFKEKEKILIIIQPLKMFLKVLDEQINISVWVGAAAIQLLSGIFPDGLMTVDCDDMT